MWGDTISSLSESCFMSNPVGKTTKTSSKQVILQMHFICFSFQDMRSVKIWRDEFKAAENLLFTQASASCFEIAPKSDTQSHTDTRDIWKFHGNIACAQVNPLCSCQSSIAALIVGGRKLAIPRSGSAFSVLRIFIFIIFVILVPISLIFFYFRLSIQEILTKPRRCMSNQSCPIIYFIYLINFELILDPWFLILDPRSLIQWSGDPWSSFSRKKIGCWL